MAEIVTSAQNPRLKMVRRLSTRRGRLREGAFAVEGEDLIIAGIRAGWEPRFLVVHAGGDLDASFHRAVEGVSTLLIDTELMVQLAELAHPPRAIGVFDLPEDVQWAGTSSSAAQPSIYLDGVRDPGNVGSIIRSANALGVLRVGLGPGTADPFSPKATRSSMGSIFDVTLVPVAGLDEFVATGAQIVALDANAETSLSSFAFSAAPVLCVGSERTGLGDQARELAADLVSIPQRPDVDSLNAAAAAAIVLYEWRRQHPAPLS